MNLAIDFAGVAMKNPVTTASGTFGSAECDWPAESGN